MIKSFLCKRISVKFVRITSEEATYLLSIKVRPSCLTPDVQCCDDGGCQTYVTNTLWLSMFKTLAWSAMGNQKTRLECGYQWRHIGKPGGASCQIGRKTADLSSRSYTHGSHMTWFPFSGGGNGVAGGVEWRYFDESAFVQGNTLKVSKSNCLLAILHE